MESLSSPGEGSSRDGSKRIGGRFRLDVRATAAVARKQRIISIVRKRVSPHENEDVHRSPAQPLLKRHHVSTEPELDCNSEQEDDIRGELAAGQISPARGRAPSTGIQSLLLSPAPIARTSVNG